MRPLTITLALATATACARTPDHSADTSSVERAAPGGVAGATTGMTAPVAGSEGMMRRMRMSLDTMQALDAASLRARLPLHREMTDGMLAQMTREMMATKMPAAPQWSALMDSVHRDLDRMRGMGSPELVKTMADHRARLTRLMALHRDMAAAQRAPR